MQVGTCFRMRDVDLKTKTRPVTQTLKPDAVIQSKPDAVIQDLKLLGHCKNEPLKKVKKQPFADVFQNRLY